MAKNKGAVPRYIMAQLDKQIVRIEKSIARNMERVRQLKKLRDDLNGRKPSDDT